MPKTLVTGANSFVAAHIIDTLIREGHDVTGSVRRASAGDELLAAHPEWKANLSTVIISDYTQEQAWSDVFKTHQFDHIVHVAAPLLDDPNLSDFDRDFLIPSVETNRSMLQAAVKDLPSLQSVAITGSVNSMTTGSPEELKTTAFTNETWSNITPEMAREAQNAYINYCSSKKEAELAVWEFVKAQQPKFSVTCLLPALIFAPPIQAVKSIKKMNYSCDTFYKLFNGTFDELPNTHTFLFPSYIDARDLAVAHVRALTAPGARNKRFLIGGKALSAKLIVDTLRHLSELSESEGGLPELKDRLPKDTGGDNEVTPVNMDASEGNSVLGLEGNLSSSEKTFGDTARKILEIEKRS